MKHNPHQPPEPVDPLDTLLRETNDYVADDGFTKSVLTRLPVPRRQSRLRPVLLSAAVLVGAALTLCLMPKWDFDWAWCLQNWSAWNWNTVLTVVPVLAALGSLGWGLWALIKDEA